MRPFGDDATSTRDGSGFSASKAAVATRCDLRSNPARGDLVSDDGASGRARALPISDASPVASARPMFSIWNGADSFSVAPETPPAKVS